jgi:hypothetical protein
MDENKRSTIFDNDLGSVVEIGRLEIRVVSSVPAAPKAVFDSVLAGEKVALSVVIERLWARGSDFGHGCFLVVLFLDFDDFALVVEDVFEFGGPQPATVSLFEIGAVQFVSPVVS